MSSAGPWSVKGIDPKAREIAKDLARRSGMTLGEWLNQMIIDGGEPEAPPPPRELEPRRPVLQAGPQFRTEPRRGYEAEPERAATDEELVRITRALDAFSSRLEAAEHRSTLAISGIDQSVMGVLSRMDGIERDQTAVGARFDGGLDEVRTAQAKLAERLRRMEQEDGPRVEAMKALETSLGKVAAQIYEGESRARGALSEVRQDLSGIARRVDRLDMEVAGKAEAGDSGAQAAVSDSIARVAERLELAEIRTSAAVQALESSFAGLDARLKATETRLDPEADSPEHRFQRLAMELQEKVEASRAEMAEHMRAAADTKLDRMESALRELSGHVEAAERQSSQAIDRMGREVMRIAQTLGQRVATVESRSAEAGAQVGGEMARIADAIESRMRVADSVQAEALEKLGGEIGRIAERLAERIAASERRSATAIDEVGDQVARVTDKINQRYDRASSELSERIRQSEERTARMLEETRETLDQRLMDTQRRPPVDTPAAPPVVTATEEPAPRVPAFGDDFGPDAAFPDDDFSHPPAAFDDDPFAAPPEPEQFAAPQADAFVEDQPEPDLAEPDHFSDAFDLPPPSPEAPARSSTRELIEAARAAARQAAASEGRGRLGRNPADLFSASTPAPSLDTPPRGLGAFLSGKRKKKKENTTLMTALLASGTAAMLATTVVGYGLVTRSHERQAETSPAPTVTPPGPTAAQDIEANDADLLAAALSAEPAPVDALPVDALPVAAASALPPAASLGRVPSTPAPVAAAAAAVTATPDTDVKQLYANAIRRIESGDATGLADLRRAANLGSAEAQFHLAKLYETGRGGVKKDLAEARRWTLRAAGAGDVKAMHNLGLYYFEGTGGPKNATEAANWFGKAAAAGLKDSQYNLARLYEQGYGVARNPAEAYKWYLIAAAGGDTEAKSSAELLRPQLTPEAQMVVQRSVLAFRPQSAALAQR